MDTNDKYRLELSSDQYVNKLIQWWNDTLFEYGRVMTLDFKEYCDLDSYNQKRTVMLNYEVLANMYKSRKSHKLDEWHDFCDWIKTLPYSELITGKE